MEQRRHSGLARIAASLPLVIACACGPETAVPSTSFTPPHAATAGAPAAAAPAAPSASMQPGAAPTTPIMQPTAATPPAMQPAAMVPAATTPAAPANTVPPTAATTPAAPGSAPISPYTLFDPATKLLAVPKAGDGVQVTTKEFDLPPGAEKFSCYHAEIPQDGEIDVKYWESTMTNGSHHFILYKADGDSSPVGTMDQSGCLSNFTSWVYSSAQPHMDLQIPEGVAMVLGSRQRVNFDLHYINTTEKTLKVQVALNAIYAKGQFQKAASLVSYNTGIFLQPHAKGSASGDCTPGQGAKFFYMLTHTHRRGNLATISRVLANGQMGETLVKSTDWEVPEEKKWITDPYMTFKQGEKIHYDCEYMNDLDQVVTAGPSAQSNEMCMAIMYYFPASAGGSCR
jgi:hypothetical protein